MGSRGVMKNPMAATLANVVKLLYSDSYLPTMSVLCSVHYTLPMNPSSLLYAKLHTNLPLKSERTKILD